MRMGRERGKGGDLKRQGRCGEEWQHPPPAPSSCSAGGHSPGKRASEHSLLSSAFTRAMPTSLLLAHLRPRNAPVLRPGRELKQLAGGVQPREGGLGGVFLSPPPLKKKKKKILLANQEKSGEGRERTITPGLVARWGGHGPSCSFPLCRGGPRGHLPRAPAARVGGCREEAATGTWGGRSRSQALHGGGGFVWCCVGFFLGWGERGDPPAHAPPRFAGFEPAGPELPMKEGCSWPRGGQGMPGTAPARSSPRAGGSPRGWQSPVLFLATKTRFWGTAPSLAPALQLG